MSNQPVELANVCGRRKETKNGKSNGKETAKTFCVGKLSYNCVSLEGQARIDLRE